MALLAKQHVSVPVTVLVVLAFNVIMLLLLEIPLVAYTFAPERAAAAVAAFTDMLARDEGRIAFWATFLVGVALVAIGAVHLLA